MDPNIIRLVVAARKVAYELQTSITDESDLALIKELDQAAEAFATEVFWDEAPDREAPASDQGEG